MAAKYQFGLNEPSIQNDNAGTLITKLKATLAQTYESLTADLVDATQSTSGFMSAADKTKIDGLEALPAKTGNQGKVLTTNGSTTSWANAGTLINTATSEASGLLSASDKEKLDNVQAIPAQSGNSGKLLTTDGESLSWTGTGGISKTFYPSAGTSSISLTSSEISNPANCCLTVYRNGLIQTLNDDYAINAQTGVLTFSPAFSSDENVLVMSDSFSAQASYNIIFDDRRVDFTPTSGSSTVTLAESNIPDSNNYSLEVYRNGLLMTVSKDYTYSVQNRTITFVTAFAADEVVSVKLGSNRTLVTSDFSPSSGDSEITLTSEAVTGSVAMSVYRNGIMMRENHDYSYYSNTKKISFEEDFIADEAVSVVIDKTSDLSRNMVYILPTSGTYAVTLDASNIPMNRGMIITVYRNGVLMRENHDYSYNMSARTFTFENVFGSDELVTAVIDSSSASLSSATGASSSSSIFTNNTTLTGTTFINALVEKFQTLGTSGNITVNCDNGNYALITPTGNVTLSFTCSSSVSNCVRTLYIGLTNGGSYSVAWPSNIYWNNGTAPELSSGFDIVSFITWDNGNTWYGVLTGSDFAQVTA